MQDDARRPYPKQELDLWFLDYIPSLSIVGLDQPQPFPLHFPHLQAVQQMHHSHHIVPNLRSFDRIPRHPLDDLLLF